MIDATRIAIAPMLPYWVLAILYGSALLVLALAVWRGANGTIWRAAILLALGGLLLNPSLVEEQRDPIDDVAVVVVDRSPSQRIHDRTNLTDETLAGLERQFGGFDDLQVRIVETTGGADGLQEETRLYAALEGAIADLPRQRLAGAILVTDGQIHDLPEDPSQLGDIGPIHALLTGAPDERDRRLSIVEAPAFGLVGEPVDVTVVVDDLPEAQDDTTATLTVTRDGEIHGSYGLDPGLPFTLPIPIDHSGPTVLEFEVDGLEDELSAANNQAALVVNGVRDRLRVLLVSGEPHPGERTWRNTLKSDPGVDLVHFTILRPPEKQDGTPLEELSLISFPTRELFEVRLDEFDLIIFDRYERRGVLPSLYLQNIADYVARGGALLEASGPPFAGVLSLYRTPLGEVFPATPTGEVLEAFYLPTVTDLGERHPVTAALQGSQADGTSDWGRWLRQIDVEATGGTTIMAGLDERPLLILDRVGDGRVAQLASDHLWLWSRGFEGGGPQGELVRRLAHWLMQEPSLEEEDLRAVSAGSRIDIERRSLEALPETVTVTDPLGDTQTLPLIETGPGLATASLAVDQAGVYRVTDGDRSTLVVVGTLNPPEARDMRATDEVLLPLIEASGGSARYLNDGLPNVRRTSAGRNANGSNWIGLRANGDYTVVGVSETSLLPPALMLILLACLLVVTWWREGD
ncbi:MAG: hypothetical protein AAF414_13220 [Pseudomonadota bacterium]